MAYTMLDENFIRKIGFGVNTLEGAALSFIRNSCEELRFDDSKPKSINDNNLDFSGTSLKKNQIPYNMEKDIDRLCMENAIRRFLNSGKKEDAFDVYFCYLEMFIGDYKNTGRMIELLSEFEANGSGLLMKHRDHYSHSVYVFCIGLALYETNESFREVYGKFYNISDKNKLAAHYLKYWGLTSLFHDIGYPFELPFEQVCSYFEVNGEKRKYSPFMAYNALDGFIALDEAIKASINKYIPFETFLSTDDLFAYILENKLGKIYGFTREEMREILHSKPTSPNKFNHFMDHAYFSATVLFKKLFCEMELDFNLDYLDSLTAILMHNSLYKFGIAKYKEVGNKPLKEEVHPLAYMLMLCDELQCFDRTAYGRNSKREVHPMGSAFDFSDNQLNVVYLYDEKEIEKVNIFKDEYIKWISAKEESKAPTLKSYSSMYIEDANGKSEFQSDIEKIVDVSNMNFKVKTGFTKHIYDGNSSYLSNSNFLNLYNFAIILNARWGNADYKYAKERGQEKNFINDENVKEKFADEFRNLSLEYKLSNINQAKGFAKYMHEINCFYVDREVDFKEVEKFNDDELVKIGLLEHHRWLQEHYDMGWRHGKPEKSKRDFERKHADMIPDFKGFDVSVEDARNNYKRLDKETRDKDTEPMECMLLMLKMFDGLRIYRLMEVE